jgi:hypothetical protein
MVNRWRYGFMGYPCCCSYVANTTFHNTMCFLTNYSLNILCIPIVMNEASWKSILNISLNFLLTFYWTIFFIALILHCEISTPFFNILFVGQKHECFEF